MNPSRPLLICLTSAWLACCPLDPLLAQNLTNAGSLPPPQACTGRFDLTPRGNHSERVGAPFVINAEEVDLARIGQSEFIGEVELERADQQVETGRLLYNKSIGEVLLPEALRYNDADYIVSAANARYLIDDGSAYFEAVRFQVKGSTANGDADQVEIQRGGIALGKDLHFTTCPGDDPDWELGATTVKLDREKGVGTARNATLKFKGIPLLYLPWLSFPLDDRRKSGFLYPTFSTTSDNGLDFAWPFYWNIAPHMDATIAPRFVSNRGPAVGGEYRFMSRRAGGIFEAEYLPDDDLFGADRNRWSARLGYQIARRWRADLNASRVSDRDYFLDFSSNIEEATTQFLQSRLALRGGGNGWNLLLQADTFQVLDRSVSENREPYRRLPRLAVDGRWPMLGNIDFTLDSEFVYFDRDVGVTGARLDVQPAIEWQLIRPGWFLKPRAGVRYTAYALDDNPRGSDSPDRSLPILSVDSGLVFEKTLASSNRMTIEPRLFYLYVPFEDQSELPNFDTADLTFGLSQLFSTNSFAGADRQTNANQVSLAVTSRLIDGDSGRQRLDLTLGQTFFLERPKVGLNNTLEEDRNTSAFIAELNYRPMSRWTATAGLQFDPEDEQLDVALAGVSYRGKRDDRWQLGYRFRRDRVDQVDFRVSYPLTPEWKLLSRWNYSFREDTTLEAIAGVEYESCCWALQVVGRRFVNDRGGSSRTGIFIELHLKGLGSLGRSPYDLFGESAAARRGL
ncbi:MAG: LPS-assembly protein LptD [Wenzhouxiangellaceae bacterium]